jgi:magnesium chelatase family protein
VVLIWLPADLPKNGTHFDLPIASFDSHQFRSNSFDPKDKLFVGELALDGIIRPVTGVLPMVLAAKDLGIKTIFIPKDNSKEAV